MPPTHDLGACRSGLRLIFVADPLTVRESLARIMASPEVALLSAEVRATVELVLAEVLNNIVEHAYAAGPGQVSLTLRSGSGGLCCDVVDAGVPMPNGRLPDDRLPGISGTNWADQPEGGFGWHLIHTLARDLVYSRDAGRNRLTFRVPFGQTD